MTGYINAFVIMFLGLTLMLLVNNYRTLIYYSQASQPILEIFQSVSFLDVIDFVIEMVTKRIEGSRELMAVMSSPLSGIDSFIDIFFNTGKIDIAESVYGFSTKTPGMAFGVTLGALGLLYTSKMIIIVFLGMFLQTLLIQYISRIFNKSGYPIAGYYFACLWIIIVLGNLSMFFVYRYLVVLMILLLFIKYLDTLFVTNSQRINKYRNIKEL